MKITSELLKQYNREKIISSQLNVRTPLVDYLDSLLIDGITVKHYPESGYIYVYRNSNIMYLYNTNSKNVAFQYSVELKYGLEYIGILISENEMNLFIIEFFKKQYNITEANLV